MNQNCEYKIDEEKVVFQNRDIIFYGAIFESLYIPDHKILIVIIGGELNSKANVYGIDILKQQIKWRINHSSPYNCYFSDLLYKNDELFARTNCNYYLKVNIEDGCELKRYFTPNEK